MFGDGSPASAYVWVSKAEPATLIDTLRKTFARKSDRLGEIASGKNGYVVQQAIPRCLPEDADRFESAFLEPVTNLLAHYAQWEPEITEATRDHLKNGR